ncbi:UNVERIFIED_CONTAM: G-type lectin S-receptor-like serine/threonine-protein kinase [Sesamum angustifolium]|uniref:G-type lectin S-receptor-like serine/threonine-protein kinase n=1 Tax=Sesamum angustifolium TaxID=2727405 RepID=A0AAW2MI65_9LAMI
MKLSQFRRTSVTALLFLIFLHCLASQVTSLDTLRRGDKLNSSSRLVSANRVFTLGFYTPETTNNSYVAIWYTDSSYYPVWIGNREKPVFWNSTPVLAIDSTGKLIITHGGGESIELYAGESSKNVSATLLDTGNFVAREVTPNGSAGEVLWQSFDHPTDTLLPGMKLGVNHRTGRNWALSSWFGENNPAPGAFTLEWDPSVGSLLIRRRGVVYWTSGGLKDYYDDLGDFRVKVFEHADFVPDSFNWNYNFSSAKNGDEEYFTYTLINDVWTPDDRKVISGWRLDYKGDIYDNRDQPDSNRPGVSFGIGLADSCYGYKAKGSAASKGCALWEQPSCRNNHETFVWRSGDFGPVNGQLVPTVYDSNSSLSLSDCREICWDDCECVAYSNDYGTSGCVYWRGKNMEFEQSLDGSRNKKYVLTASSSKGRKKHILITAVVLSTTVLLIVGIALFVLRKIRQGKTPEGQDIAVKLLSRQSGQGLLEFKTELILISKLQHVNLVKLLGFCVHGDDKMIIYDYMPNKSLDFFLFSPSDREPLNWQQRFNIIEGIAQGLLYLHKYSRLKIIHRDLKPSNILLDKDMNPKISDFGLARIFKQNMNEANTNRRVGTYGYMAPEYAMQGIFSVKSDVYSFGVLVLEIVSGRKNNSFHQMEGPLNLVEYDLLYDCVTGFYSSAAFTFVNKCEFTVWPGIFSNRGTLPTSGFALETGGSKIINASSSWGGRLWGRTNCGNDSSGKFSCITGDCGTGKLECDGGRTVPTVTLAEFQLDSLPRTDFYDVSLVFGYNLPILVTPKGGSGASCVETGCVADVNGACPSELRVTSVGGEGVACKSACQAFLEDQYCCRGANNSPDTCKPTQYSQVFKSACPQAFSYAYDDANTTFSCTGAADYTITFCPFSNAR